MKITSSNIYVKEHGKDVFVICIEMPDNSRNYIHSQNLILMSAIEIADELRGIDLTSDANNPYLERDGEYYRIKMTIPPSKLSFESDISFHSRKLNLIDAYKERQMLLDDSPQTLHEEQKS